MTDRIASAARAFVERVRNDPEHSSESFSVHTELVEGTHVKAHVRSFILEYDEPPIIGGDDLGPGPAESTLAALGASLIQFYVIQSRLLEVPIEGVEVDVTGELDLTGVFRTLPDAIPGYSSIHFQTRLQSSADRDAIETLVSVVEATTPVMAAFRNPVPVTGTTSIERGSQSGD